LGELLSGAAPSCPRRFSTPFHFANGSVSPNRYWNTESYPGAHRLGSFRPMLLYGDFHHTCVRNIRPNTPEFPQELREMWFSNSACRSQGHRLLASHDIDPANPQTCLDIMTLSVTMPPASPLMGSRRIAVLLEDNQYTVPSCEQWNLLPTDSICHRARFRLPGRRLTFVGLALFVTPNANPVTGGGNGCR